MIYFLLSLTCFFLFILIHAITFRLNLIRFEIWKLGLICFFGAVVYLSVNTLIIRSDNEILQCPLKWSSLAIYALLSLWYFGETTTVQYNSPSMKIMNALCDSSSKKITIWDVKHLFSDQELIVSRLDDLVAHGHIRYQDGKFSLLARGRLIVNVFKLYRWILGRGLGG